MGFPILLAFGATALTVGAVTLYNVLKDDDDYRDNYWSDLAKAQKRAEEQAQIEREVREYQARIALIEDKINRDISTARKQIVNAYRTLESSELFNVDYNDYKYELHDLLSDKSECSDKFDAQNQLINTKTNKNLAFLDNYSCDIRIELNEDGENICNAYKECKQSELELKRHNEQLTNALKQLRQKHKAIRHTKTS